MKISCADPLECRNFLILYSVYVKSQQMSISEYVGEKEKRDDSKMCQKSAKQINLRWNAAN
jgi:hypothetical protein